MIQRKQSLWLLIAALLGACLFFFDIYRADVNTGGVVESKALNVSGNYPLMLIAIVMTALPFITIFMFRDRKRQVRMSAMSLVAVMSFISLMLMQVNRFAKEGQVIVKESYWVGAVLPAAALLFIVLAIIGIRRDESLVRSADRLR